MKLKFLLLIFTVLNITTLFGQAPPADLRWELSDDDIGSTNNFTPTSPSYSYSLNIGAPAGTPGSQNRMRLINTGSLLEVKTENNRTGMLFDGLANAPLMFSSNNSTDIGNQDDHPNFWGLGVKGMYNTKQVDGVTIALYVYLDENTFEKNIEQVLVGATTSTNPTVDNTQFGLSIKGKKLYFKMYDTTDEDGEGTPGLPWKYEIWEPGSLDAGTGWYQIFLVMAHTQKYMQIIIHKPTTVEYGNDKTVASFRSNYAERLIWMPGIRDGMRKFRSWFLGLSNNLIYSDFRLWNNALSTKSVQDIIINNGDEIIENESNTTDFGNKNLVQENVEEIDQNKEEVFEKQDLIIYPNPTDGKISLHFPSNIKYGEEINLKLVSMNGTVLFSEQITVNSSIYELNFKDLFNINSGSYLLNINSINFSDSEMIIIK